MFAAQTPFQAKSGAQTELPEDHCLDLEDPEDEQQENQQEAEE